MTPRGPCVVGRSGELGRQGVSLGMPVAEALAISRRQHPEGRENARQKNKALHLEPYNPIADHEALIRLAQWCHRFSPIVGLEEEQPPETLLLDITGMDLFAGGEAILIAQVRDRFRQRGMSVRLGWGPTLGNAWALAHYSSDCAEIDLKELPIEALRLPVKTQQILIRLRLDRIGDLLSLPRAELQNVAGSLLLRRLDQAMGRSSEVIQAVHSPHHFSVHWETEYGLLHRESIGRVMRRQAEDLCKLLKKRGRGALCIACRIQCQDATDRVFQIGLFLPCAAAGHLQRLLELQAETLSLTEPVTGISLHVLQDALLTSRQRELFANRKYHAKQDLADLVDCLNSRLGTRSVLRVFLQNDDQPENAYREEPMVAEHVAKRRSATKRLHFLPLERPLCLVNPPVLLPVTTEVSSGSPICFSYATQKHKVFRYWGPERIETGWWRRSGVRRDYYRVETTEGLRFWLFRCLQIGDWFLQGVFD